MTQINVDRFVTQPPAGKGRAASGPASEAGAFGAVVDRKLGLGAKESGADSQGSSGGWFQKAPASEATAIDIKTEGAALTAETEIAPESDAKVAGAIQELLTGEHVLTLSQIEGLAACPEIQQLAENLAGALAGMDLTMASIPAESAAAAGTGNANENAGANAEAAMGLTGSEELKSVRILSAYFQAAASRQVGIQTGRQNMQANAGASGAGLESEFTVSPGATVAPGGETTAVPVALPVPEVKMAAVQAAPVSEASSTITPKVQSSGKSALSGLPGKAEAEAAPGRNAMEAVPTEVAEKAPAPASAPGVATPDIPAQGPERAPQAQSVTGSKTTAPVPTQPENSSDLVQGRVQVRGDAQSGTMLTRVKSDSIELESDIDLAVVADAASSADAGSTPVRSGSDVSSGMRKAEASQADRILEMATVQAQSGNVQKSMQLTRNSAANAETLESKAMEIDYAVETQAGVAAASVAQTVPATMSGAGLPGALTGNSEITQVNLETDDLAEQDEEPTTIMGEPDPDATSETGGLAGNGVAAGMSTALSSSARATGNSGAATAAPVGEDAASLDVTAMETPEQNGLLSSLANPKATGEAVADTKNTAGGMAAAVSTTVAAQVIVGEDVARNQGGRGSLRGNSASRGAGGKVARLQAEKTDARVGPVLTAAEVAEGFAKRMVKSIEGDLAAVEQADAVEGVRTRQNGSNQSGLFMGNERASADAAAMSPIANTMRANFAETLAADRTMRMADRVERLQDLIGRMDEHVLSMLSDKGRSMTIQLTPENLGRVSLNCLENGKEIRLDIVVENNSVRTLMQQQESALKEMLTQAGYRLMQFDVRSQSDGANSRQANKNPKNMPGKGRGPEHANTETAAVSETPVANPMVRSEQVWYIA